MPFFADLDLSRPCRLCGADAGEPCFNVINGKMIEDRTHRTRRLASVEQAEADAR